MEVYLEGGCKKANTLISILLQDRYGHDEKVMTVSSIPELCSFLSSGKKEDHHLSLDAAFILGTLVRRLPSSPDMLIIQVKSQAIKQAKSKIEYHLSNLCPLKSVDIRLVEGKYWSWLHIEMNETLRLIAKLLPRTNVVPRLIRSADKEVLTKWYDGVSSVTSTDSGCGSLFTFLDERQIREMISFSQILSQKGCLFIPTPIYRPMDVELKVGGPLESNSSIVSILKSTEGLQKIITEEKYWSPIVNSVIVKLG
jgi:hypothetical protein